MNPTEVSRSRGPIHRQVHRGDHFDEREPWRLPEVEFLALCILSVMTGNAIGQVLRVAGVIP